MSKSCVICGGDESEGELLVDAPCGRHWVCTDDIASFFQRATENESLFPPKCCGQMFMLQEYEDYIPFETTWAYQVKEQGEYATLAKFRVYCANPACAKFLHPASHVEDPEMNITYAICESADCCKWTCVRCKALLDQGTQNHTCLQNEIEQKFKQTATEKGFQECSVCGATVELAEACNHITCNCGHDFCYICNQDWPGLHGCPHYGPATYDEEGYNQDGFHRDTGLNRDGLTRRQDIARARGEGDADEEDDDEEEEDLDWDVLQHLTPDQRIAINVLHGEEREDALDQHRIELFETQGITFNQGQPQPLPNDAQDVDDEEGAQGEDDEEGAEDEDDEGGNEDWFQDHEDWVRDPEVDGDWVQWGQDPEDDGDHFIDEEGLQGDRFADDQSEDDHDATDVPQVDDDQSEAAVADSNAPHIGSVVYERGAEDLDNQLRESFMRLARDLNARVIDPVDYTEGRASSSSESDEIRPATPMDLDDPAEEVKGPEQL